MVKAEDYPPGCGGDDGFGSPADGYAPGGGILTSSDNIIESAAGNASIHTGLPPSGIFCSIMFFKT